VPGAEQLSALNILLTRAAYDLLRSTRVQEFMHKRVEKQISDIRTPPYMSKMKLVNLDLGKTPPVITGMTAEPATPGCIMPVLSLQIAYRGEFNLTIETTVDPREAAGWSRIGRAIDFVQGSKGEQLSDEAAVAAAAAEVHALPLSGDSGAAASTRSADEPPADGSSPRGSSPPPPGSSGQRSARRGALMPLRKAAAAKARQFVDRMGEYISKVPVRLHVKVSHLRGTMLVWIAPPPTDRLWYAFQDQPKMDIVARPEIGGHQLKYMGVANRVSSWVAAKLQVAVTNTLVFPSCGDLKLAFLLPFEPEAMLPILAATLPGTQADLLRRAAQSGPGPAAAGFTLPTTLSAPARLPTGDAAGRTAVPATARRPAPASAAEVAALRVVPSEGAVAAAAEEPSGGAPQSPGAAHTTDDLPPAPARAPSMRRVRSHSTLPGDPAFPR